jgi:hypothetical protein
MSNFHIGNTGVPHTPPSVKIWTMESHNIDISWSINVSNIAKKIKLSNLFEYYGVPLSLAARGATPIILQLQIAHLP